MRNESFEGGARTFDNARVAQEARVVVQRQNQPVHLEQHLLHLRVGTQMAFLQGDLDRASERLLPSLHHADQRVAHRPRAVVEFDRAADVDATRIDFHRNAPHPQVEQRAQPRQPARLLHRGVEHLLLEPRVVLAHHRNLQLLARAEMREHARLAHLRDVGDGADRQALESRAGGQAEGGVQDHGAGVLPLQERTRRDGEFALRRRRRHRRSSEQHGHGRRGLGPQRRKRTVVLFCRDCNQSDTATAPKSHGFSRPARLEHLHRLRIESTGSGLTLICSPWL